MDASLDVFEKEIQDHVEVKLKGCLGLGEKDDREMRALNKIVRVSAAGLLYGPDSRHVELCRGLDLTIGPNSAVNPGNKVPYDEENSRLRIRLTTSARS